MSNPQLNKWLVNDITAQAYKDGVKQGRADQLKEDTPYFAVDIDDKTEAKIRADERAKVVDETIDKVWDRLKDYECFDDVTIDLNMLWDELNAIKEQRKEQKNE